MNMEEYSRIVEFDVGDLTMKTGSNFEKSYMKGYIMRKNKLLFLYSAILLFIILGFPSAPAWAEGGSQRIAGPNRYITAVKVSQAGWTSSEYVILASGQDYADALCSGSLASKYSAPILLTEPQEVPPEVLAEVERLKAKQVFLIGGPQAISYQAERQLRALSSLRLERLGGQDRYETAVRVAQKLANSLEVALVSGESPWDALAFNAIAAQRAMPILLTAKNELPAVVREFLAEQPVSRTYLIGGENVLSQNIEKKVPGSVRLAGKDRYETNALILNEFADQLNFKKIYVVAGGGRNDGFADALCAAALAGRTASPLLLAGGKAAEELKEYLTARIPASVSLIAVGGEAAVPAATLVALHNQVQAVNKAKTGGGNFPGLDGGNSSGSDSPPEIDNLPPSSLTISAQNCLPAQGSVTLRVVDGPLSDASWLAVFEEIKAHTGKGQFWIIGINEDDLTLTPAADGVTAVLANHSVKSAGLAADFVIPASKLTDRAGNQAVQDLSIDAHLPVNVTGVGALTPDGLYKAGDALEFTVTFSDKVDVAGTPLLQLAAGSVLRNAVYTGGSGTEVLTFGYTVENGDLSARLDYASAAALNLNGGTIKITGTPVDAVILLPLPGESGSLGKNINIQIDACPPTAINISAQNLLAGQGSIILEAVDGPLTAESWAEILQVIKDHTGIAGSWIAGIAAEDLALIPAADGVTAVLSNRSVNPAVIRADFIIPAAKVSDRAGNTAEGDIKIDAYFPRMVTKVSTTTGKGYYKAGAEIYITVAFDRAVEVEGIPTLELETGAIDRPASYTAGSGTQELTFVYTVQAGDTSANLTYTGGNALRLNGGTIRDKLTGEEVNLTLPDPGEGGLLPYPAKIVIDTTPPTAIEISAQNLIPLQGFVTLTAVEGPLSDSSWTKVFNLIKTNTINGKWIQKINSTDLSINYAIDGGITAKLENKNRTTSASIQADFVIPANLVVDKAGNEALTDIIIDAKS